VIKKDDFLEGSVTAAIDHFNSHVVSISGNTKMREIVLNNLRFMFNNFKGDVEKIKKTIEESLGLNPEIEYYKKWLKELQKPAEDIFIVEDYRSPNFIMQYLMHTWSSRIPEFNLYTGGLPHRFALEILRYQSALKISGVEPSIQLPSSKEYSHLSSLKADFHHNIADLYLSFFEQHNPNASKELWRGYITEIISRQAIYAENFGKPVDRALERMKQVVDDSRIS
jgi:hypothetical protein